MIILVIFRNIDIPFSNIFKEDRNNISFLNVSISLVEC